MPLRKPGGRKRRRSGRRILVAAVVIVILISLPTAYYYWPVPKGKGISIPVQLMSVGEKPPLEHLPYNETTAKLYARSLLADYINVVDSKVRYTPEFQSVEPWLYIYPTQGKSWEIIVAKENSTQPKWIEFIFMKQIPSPDPSEPQIFSFMNESAQYVRAVTISPTSAAAGSLNASFGHARGGVGVYFRNFAVDYVAGNRLIPFVWITNMSSVFNDTTINADAAARALYYTAFDDMNYQLNPSFKTNPLAWLRNVWNLIDYPVFVVVGGVVTFVMFYWEVLPRVKQLRKPPESETKGKGGKHN